MGAGAQLAPASLSKTADELATHVTTNLGQQRLVVKGALDLIVRALCENLHSDRRNKASRWRFSALAIESRAHAGS